MKTLMLILVAFISISHLAAQVKTGGGGGPDFESPDRREQTYKEMERLKYVFKDFSKELMKIEKDCTGRKSFPPKYNFIDSFYSLVLKKANDTTPINKEDCRPSKKIASCLEDKELKKITKEISQTSGGVLYQFLEKEYKLDKKDAQVIIQFFIEK